MDRCDGGSLLWIDVTVFRRCVSSLCFVAVFRRCVLSLCFVAVGRRCGSSLWINVDRCDFGSQSIDE